MKKLIKVVSFLVVLFCTQNALALVGFGVHGGLEMFEEKKFDESFQIGGYNYSLEREAISQPIHAGAQFQIDLPIIPIGIELDGGLSWAEYKWKAPTTINGNSFDIPGVDSKDGFYSETFHYLHANADVTVKYYFISFPPVVNTISLYVGGGAGYHYVTPIVSKDLFIEELKDIDVSNGAKIDVDDLVYNNSSFGGHFVVGAKIKPPVIPFSFNIDYRHNFIPENDYGDETSSLGQIKVGMNFYL